MASPKNFKQLWHPGDLFHACHRYPREGAPKVDRLAGILKYGLVAPARCKDGTVLSDLNIVVTGSSMPYDDLVFLHRFGERSFIYTMCDPGRFFVFVDPTYPVLTPDDMGENWVILCQDEVYVQERVALERLTSIVIDSADAESVMSELLGEFQRARIPLYEYGGAVLWAPE